MRRLLVTGFEPFPGVPHNPTVALVEGLPASIGGALLTKAILPVDTARLGAALEALEPARFDALVHTGVARDRAVVSLERRAVNRLAFAVADNAGARPLDEPIVPGGPLELRARLPLARFARAFEAEGVPIEMSDSAGSYLCNQLMYLSLARTTSPSGFVHIPPDEQLAATLGEGTPHLPRADVRAGLVRALDALATSLEELAGAEHPRRERSAAS